jgi:hypothetical protein
MGHLRSRCSVTTAPIVPPSRTKASSFPKAKRIAPRTASATGPVVGPRKGKAPPSATTFTSGFSRRTWARIRREMRSGRWSGTSRQETFTSARPGTIDLRPGPEYPPTMPWTSKVGRAQMRSSTSARLVVRMRRSPLSRRYCATENPERTKSCFSARESGRTSS